MQCFCLLFDSSPIDSGLVKPNFEYKKVNGPGEKSK